MKILIKNLRRILLVQLFIVGVILSITATNAGAEARCNDPKATGYAPDIGMWSAHHSESVDTYGEYITLGDIDEEEFTKECKNYTNFRKVFRDKIKASHSYCEGTGEVCEYTGSTGCGLQESSNHLLCKCNIEFTYCTQTSLGKKLDPSLKSRGKNEF